MFCFLPKRELLKTTQHATVLGKKKIGSYIQTLTHRNPTSKRVSVLEIIGTQD